MDPFRILPRCRAKTLPLRSGTQRAIESDGRERADHGGDRIEFGDLPVWIEERYEKKPGKTASQGPKRDLNGNDSWPAGAAVTVSQMPLAAGTCGHRFAEGKPAQTIPQRFEPRQMPAPGSGFYTPRGCRMITAATHDRS
jgi:hypothetical protein